MSQTEVEGVVGTSVHVRPAVVVKDISGKPVKGILVMFTVSQLISSVLAPRGVITDAEGIAKVPEWVLGARAGVQTLTAAIRESPNSVTFRAQANPDAPSKLSGTSVQVSLTADTIVNAFAWVADRFGNGVPDVPVLFEVIEGGGRTEFREMKTNRFGAATMGQWILGPVPGRNSISARVLDLDSIVLAVEALDASRFVLYDLESIDGNHPRAHGIERGYVALGDTGVFLDEITGTANYEFAGTFRGWGRFRTSGTTVEVQHYYELLEMRTIEITEDALRIGRPDPYTFNCCVTWRYTRRQSTSASPP